MSYSIEIKESARKALSKIQKSDQVRICKAIEDLKENPRPSGVKKLKGNDNWRIRVGNYRVVYEIDDEIIKIIVLAMGHRREIYKEL